MKNTNTFASVLGNDKLYAAVTTGKYLAQVWAGVIYGETMDFEEELGKALNGRSFFYQNAVLAAMSEQLFATWCSEDFCTNVYMLPTDITMRLVGSMDAFKCVHKFISVWDYDDHTEVKDVVVINLKKFIKR